MMTDDFVFSRLQKTFDSIANFCTQGTNALSDRRPFILPSADNCSTTTAYTQWITGDGIASLANTYRDLAWAINVVRDWHQFLRENKDDNYYNYEAEPESEEHQLLQTRYKNLTGGYEPQCSEQKDDIRRDATDEDLKKLLHREVTKWAGKSEVNFGCGRLDVDRAFLFRLQEKQHGLTHKEGVLEPRTKGDLARAALLEESLLSLPVKCLIGRRIADTPGLGDEDTLKKRSTVDSTQRAHSVICVMEKGRDLKSNGSVVKMLKASGFIKRLLQNPDKYRLMVYHNLERDGLAPGANGEGCQEKITLDFIINHHDKVVQRQDALYKNSRKYVQQLLRNAATESPEDQRQLQIQRALQSVFVFSPLMLLDTSMRMSMRPVLRKLQEYQKRNEEKDDIPTLQKIQDICQGGVLQGLIMQSGKEKVAVKEIRSFQKQIDETLSQLKKNSSAEGKEEEDKALPAWIEGIQLLASMKKDNSIKQELRRRLKADVIDLRVTERLDKVAQDFAHGVAAEAAQQAFARAEQTFKDAARKPGLDEAAFDMGDKLTSSLAEFPWSQLEKEYKGQLDEIYQEYKAVVRKRLEDVLRDLALPKRRSGTPPKSEESSLAAMPTLDKAVNRHLDQASAALTEFALAKKRLDLSKLMSNTIPDVVAKIRTHALRSSKMAADNAKARDILFNEFRGCLQQDDQEEEKEHGFGEMLFGLIAAHLEKSWKLLQSRLSSSHMKGVSAKITTAVVQDVAKEMCLVAQAGNTDQVKLVNLLEAYNSELLGGLQKLKLKLPADEADDKGADEDGNRMREYLRRLNELVGKHSSVEASELWAKAKAYLDAPPRWKSVKTAPLHPLAEPAKV